jgi:hypothetical protein
MYMKDLQEEEKCKREKSVKPWDISQTKAKSVQTAINHTAPN